MMGNKPTNNYIPRSHSRRRGQALLLAVLMMVFIVLLGTTFIAIVASNMSNTARTGAKDEARQAALAGIEFADKQLTGSNAGLDWRPAFPSTSFYYSAFDRAQGWDQLFYNAHFVKYPNPQGTSASEASNTANFMIRVSQVQYTDPDNIGNIRTGDIRIESIGFASDDPAAYYKTVAYKRGSASNPLTAAMRSVSNWDWDVNGVVQGEVLAGASNNTLTVYNSSMNIDGGFAKDDYITVWDKTGNRVTGAVISTVTPVDSNTATLTLTSLIPAPSTGSIVQKAVALSAPVSLKFDNATDTSVSFNISGGNNPYGTINNTPGSVWVNGGLVWYSTNPKGPSPSAINSTNLVAPSAGTSAAPASNIKVSGLYASISAAASYNSTKVQVTGTAKIGGVTTPISAQLPANSLYAADTNPLISNELVQDGLNRLRGSLDPLRQVEPFTPPDITAGGNGFGRYRQLTQYSSPILWAINYPEAAAYGYGQGIYINNPTDVEKADNKAMTQAQLHDLWFEDASAEYGRTSEPASPTVSNKSLEEQHLRGWVSPDQFLPRGAEVVLNNTNPPTITVTLDARSDNDADTTNGYENLYSTMNTIPPVPAHMVNSKMWRDRDGSIQNGVYIHTFPWPKNGTIFAEGNIRIQGQISAANSPTNSLTVVSMNNIYIEGSLSAGNKKVLLLAKKNVIVNPTQVLESSETVSTLASDVNSGNDIYVNDASGFHVGDFIMINDTLPRYITNINGNQLTLDGNAMAAGTYTAGMIVHTAFDPTLAGTALPATVATRLGKFDQAMVRHLRVSPTDPANLRLAFRHSAEYKKALTVKIDPSLDGNNTPGTRIDSAELYNKAMGSSGYPVITSGNKYLQIDHTETPIAADGTLSPQTSGTDKFADNLAATPYQTNTGDPTDVTAADNISLGDLYKQMLEKYTTPHWDYGNIVVTPPPPDWLVTHTGTSIQNNAKNGHTTPDSSTSGNQWVDITNINNTTNPAQYHTDNAKHPRFYFMASVGNRNAFGVSPTGTYFPTIKQPVYPTPAESFTIPMATSVWLKLNGQQATLQGNQWLAGTFNDFFKVLQFGFAPVFVNQDSAGNPIVSGVAQNYADFEDALTSDQYFYQPYGKEAIYDDGYGSEGNYDEQTNYDEDAKYTLDSRLIANPGVINGATNTLVLQLNNMEIGGNSLDYYFQNGYQIPFYRLSNLKLQKETINLTSHELTEVRVGTTFDINAYVYAQEGGWYVIPGTYFDKDVKNGNDLNRDGVVSQGEDAAAYRYHRYNYQIVFTGAIMENEMASPADVTDWTDKWATVKFEEGVNATYNPTPAGWTMNTKYNSANPATANFNTILYYYDPEAAQGLPNTDKGFHAPVAPGLIYQG